MVFKQKIHENLDGYLQRHRRGWNFDTAQRYLAAKAIIQKHGLAEPAILDVGSSGVGLSVYWQEGRARFTDLDPVYPAYRLSQSQVQATAEQLPFAAGAFEVVVSIDMLEHVPPTLRSAVIADMLRVTKRLFIVAMPVGPNAQAQDADVAKLYQERRGQSFKFVEEHILYGLPEVPAVCDWIKAGLLGLGRAGQITVRDNANLFFRSLAMRWYIEDQWGLLQKTLMAAMPVLYRLNWGPCYRKFFVVTLDDGQSRMGRP